MEPNKLEQNFKNKLEQRTIEPTPMAWDRLDAMLSVNEQKKKPNNRTWMYMAAAFLLFLSIGAFFLKSEDNVGNAVETTVVDAENPSGTKTNSSIEAEPINAIDKLIALPVNKEAGDVALQQNNNKTVNKLTKQNSERVTIKTAVPVMVQETVQQQGIAINEVPQTPAAETEQLLASSLDNTKAYKKKQSVKVDAGSLLSSVEGELDNSFRQDMLQKLVKNYNTVKTSVANRNYENK